MGWTLAQVALGGALGSMARFGVQTASVRLLGPGVPLGTLVVNVVGCFLIGVLFVWLAERGAMRAAPFLVAGLLGGFTTFSTFSLDALALWERGHWGLAAGYVAASVGLSLLAVVAGAFAARAVWA
ncbi:fluoride efflux transporter CrcB [Rhodobaculum claviforme]|uniref:Fluoride-specific ion channel FluC n=1 Tax=Rhodobaculum claviforme TaxID=1549854 RepID=A0A934WIQ2_9RHOB|nr:fluoride efflux transporter CrcB [Rhodobaculum claviforme]MBK5927106.1 protein CrcB [Rhodobaculum claviforme]